MEKFNIKDKIIYKVPSNISGKIESISVLNLYINKDINEVLAEYLVTERNIKKILLKKELTWIEWRQLKKSCESALTATLKNNGILMEFIGQILIAEIFNIESLIKYNNPNYETPEQGIDIIFYNENLEIFIFEVKSKVSDNNNISEFCGKIKNALTSLYCAKELRNQKKLAIARETINDSVALNKEKKDILFNLLEQIEDNDEDFEELSKKDNITLNICLIGNGFNITQEEINNNLGKFINSTRECKSNCKNADKDHDKCLINKLGNIKIINMISLEFAKELELEELNKQIIKKIEEEGLDSRNE